MGVGCTHLQKKKVREETARVLNRLNPVFLFRCFYSGVFLFYSYSTQVPLFRGTEQPPLQ